MALASMIEAGAHQEPASADPQRTGPEGEGPAPAASAAIADGVERQLDPRWITLQRVSGGIFLVVVSGANLMAFAGALVSGEVPAWVLALWGGLGLLVSLTLAIFTFRWPLVEHRYAGYRLDAQRLEIRRGVVWRRVMDVPKSRVQHTDVSQGPLERYFDLGTLVVFTAGTDHAKVELPGLAHAMALQIRDHLLPGESADAV